jgi:catechol 2,3-dioxygenase-like lactoylglutathione lyase family enzyme
MANRAVDGLTVFASNYAASLQLYETALAPLGIEPLVEFTSATGFGRHSGKPEFWILAGEPVTSGLHVAFVAPSRVAVNLFFDVAVAAGGVPQQGPAELPEHHPGYYAAYVMDPDGNSIEAVHHG